MRDYAVNYSSAECQAITNLPGIHNHNTVISSPHYGDIPKDKMGITIVPIPALLIKPANSG
jgi:hypothetical protein